MKIIILSIFLFLQTTYANSLNQNIDKCHMIWEDEDHSSCLNVVKVLEQKMGLSKDYKRELGYAYFKLGHYYRYTMKDYKNAVNSFEKAYKYDYHKIKSDIMTKLGYYYSTGKGTSQNKIKAYNYYMIGAKLGNVDSQDNLDNLCKKHSWACK